MPQMMPMKWMYLFILSIINLYIIMFNLNSLPLELNFKIKFLVYKLNWKWMW